MMKNNNVAKGEGIEKEAQKLRGFGIIMISIAIINPIFLILGIIFLARANDISRRIKSKAYHEEPNHEIKLFCTNCGMQQDSHDIYCFSCGKELD